MTNHAVVIVGGGPTGLMLAAELALAHVDVVVVERRETQALEGARAGGLHARTIEVLDQRGVSERFLAQGKIMQIGGFALIPLPIDGAPTRHPYGLALAQEHIERLLADWVSELGVPILRGREVMAFSQDERGVDVEVGGHGSLRAQYLVGCDGGRSSIRKCAGIEFRGWDPSVSYLIAECRVTEELPAGPRRDDKGLHGLAKLGEGGRVRVVSVEREIRQGTPTLDELRAALIAVWGTDFGVHDVTWISRFTDAARQAASYRERRVLLAGDAAHVHSPAGGQGLNLGVQDAVNLGWKLAQVVRGTSPESLLDTYQTERHPVAARVLEMTMAQTALSRGDDRTNALRAMMSDVLAMDEPRRRYAAKLSGLDIRYELVGARPDTPLVGGRMPDLDVVTESGTRRVFSFLHGAKPLLLCFDRALAIGAWADRVNVVSALCEGAWELPVLGEIEAPKAVLVRPDGYVAWEGRGSEEGLREALTAWCGPPDAGSTKVESPAFTGPS